MIIAYASGDSTPIANPDTDPSVDLSSTTLPATVTIYGAAEDSENPTASFSWQWTLLDPTTATIFGATSQNVVVTVTEWHNVRVHLVATNTATGETSESNILITPSSSFCEVRVLSAVRGIQKPAKGSRDWHPALETWASEIESTLLPDTVLSDLSDVTATGPQVDVLVSGGDAVLGGNVLHTHPGTHVAPATSSSPGTVTLESIGSSLSPTTIPKVLVEERLVYSQAVDQSVDINVAGGYSNKIIAHSSAVGNHPHTIFRADEDIELRYLSIVLLDCGDQHTQYRFDVCHGSAQDVQTFGMTKEGLALQLATQPNAHYPALTEHNFSTPLEISAGEYFGVLVQQSPAEADAGRGLRVTFKAVRVLN